MPLKKATKKSVARKKPFCLFELKQTRKLKLRKCKKVFKAQKVVWKTERQLKAVKALKAMKEGIQNYKITKVAGKIVNFSAHF